MNVPRIGCALICCLIFFGCEEDKSLSKVESYKGAMIQSANIETYYSDSAKLKMRLKAPKQFQYQNGDMEYPEGVEVYFYSDKSQEKTLLTADNGYFNKQKNIYTVSKNVVVTDLIEAKTLQTEILHWSPVEKKIFTDKFVVIKDKVSIVKGTGFTANQDFQYYKILNPTGKTITKKQ